MLLQPHVVFRTRPDDLTTYWTGTIWSPDMVNAKHVEWWAGLGLITHYRSDPDMRDYGFGMRPAR